MEISGSRMMTVYQCFGDLIVILGGVRDRVFRVLDLESLPLTTVGTNTLRDLDLFMEEASLRNVSFYSGARSC